MACRSSGAGLRCFEEWLFDRPFRFGTAAAGSSGMRSSSLATTIFPHRHFNLRPMLSSLIRLTRPQAGHCIVGPRRAEVFIVKPVWAAGKLAAGRRAAHLVSTKLRAQRFFGRDSKSFCGRLAFRVSQAVRSPGKPPRSSTLRVESPRITSRMLDSPSRVVTHRESHARLGRVKLRQRTDRDPGTCRTGMRPRSSTLRVESSRIASRMLDSGESSYGSGFVCSPAFRRNRPQPARLFW